MKTSYQTENTQIIDIAHGGTGTSTIQAARQALVVPASAYSVGESSIYYDTDANALHVRHDVDANTAGELIGSATNFYYHVKTNGTWKTTPIPVSAGGTGGTSQETALKSLSLAFNDGNNFGISSACLNGFITQNATWLVLPIPVHRHMWYHNNFQITAFHGVLRGNKGYLDGNNGDRNLLASPFSVQAIRKKTSTLLEVVIQKSSAFTNVDNNTPISCVITFSITMNP